MFQKNVLDHIDDEYNNTFHITIKIKPIDLNPLFTEGGVGMDPEQFHF